MGTEPMCHSPLALNKADSRSEGQPLCVGLLQCIYNPWQFVAPGPNWASLRGKNTCPTLYLPAKAWASVGILPDSDGFLGLILTLSGNDVQRGPTAHRRETDDTLAQGGNLCLLLHAEARDGFTIWGRGSLFLIPRAAMPTFNNSPDG